MTLSPKQRSIKNGLKSSIHPNSVIASRAGVGEISLWHWSSGRHEPSTPLYNATMQAIEELKHVAGNYRINWDSRIGELIPLREQGMGYRPIARHLNVGVASIRAVCIRWGI